MRWHGDPTLPRIFIPFLAGLAIFIGEIFPVWLERLTGIGPDAPGTKASLFAGLDMFIPTVILYLVLGTIFWWLYRRWHWLVVAVIAALLGTSLEFVVFKPEEAGGPNVANDPAGALLFFLIIWPVLLVLPYGLYQLIRRRWASRLPVHQRRMWTIIVPVLVLVLIAAVEWRIRLVYGHL